MGSVAPFSSRRQYGAELKRRLGGGSRGNKKTKTTAGAAQKATQILHLLCKDLASQPISR